MKRLVLIFTLLLSIPVFSQEKLLTLDDIYDPAKRINFSGKMMFGLQWIDDGKSYLERRGGQVMKIDAVSGAATPFYDAAKAEAAFAKIEGITAPEAKTLSMRLQLKPKFNAGMVNFKNDIFYYDLSTDAATRLTKNVNAEENEDISPDGKKVAFVRNFNYSSSKSLRRKKLH